MSINKTLSFSLFILSFFLIFSLFRGINRLVRVEKRITQIKEKLEKIKEENQELKEIKSDHQTEAFFEEQVRNKLQMAKGDEVILILPEQLTEAKQASLATELKQEAAKANWQKWLELFL